MREDINAYEDPLSFRSDTQYDYCISDFSTPSQQLTVINHRLYVVDLITGEIFNYDDIEMLVGGGILSDLFLQYSTADTAKSKQAHREYANMLGDLPSKAEYNGIKEYAEVLNKPDFTKVFALCQEVDRRNLAFIKRTDLCSILNTTPDHLSRVLKALEQRQYIKVDKAEHQKGTLKIWVNPSFIWKGDLANRWISGEMQGFPVIERKRRNNVSTFIFEETEKAMVAFNAWYTENGHKANQAYSNEWYAEISIYDNAHGEGVRLAAENPTLSRLLNPATSEGDFIRELFTPAQYQTLLRETMKKIRKIH